MGKISDLFYKLTRGKDAPKPNEFGPAKTLKAKCGCGGQCGCNSVESLEKSAGVQKKISVQIVKATTDNKPSTIPADLKAHLLVEGLNKKAKTIAKKPVAKVTEKKQAIAKDLADTPAPVAKKPTAKKPATPTAKKPAPKKK